MYVQLDFEQEGLIYRVVRRRSRKQRGAGTLDLLAQDESGQFNLISEPSMRATQERINGLLRLDYETFTNSAFLQQGKADAFTTRVSPGASIVVVPANCFTTRPSNSVSTTS